MNEPTETPQAAAPVANQNDIFDGEAVVEELFDRFNRATSPHVNRESEQQPSEPAAGEAPPSAEESVSPAQPQETADYWKQRYDSLQSDMDRRVNRGKEELRNEFNQTLSQLTQAIIAGRGGQPAQPETFETASQDPQKIEQYFNAKINQGIAHALNSDPRVAAGAAVNETAKFQQDHPDWGNYFAVIEPALKWFPVKPGESYYQRLEQAYEFAKDMYAKAAEQAKAQGAANNANRNGQTTTPQPQGRVTGEQRQQMISRSGNPANERGVSATVNTKPTIDPYDPRKLRANIDRLVEHALKNS